MVYNIRKVPKYGVTTLMKSGSQRLHMLLPQRVTSYQDRLFSLKGPSIYPHLVLDMELQVLRARPGTESFLGAQNPLVLRGPTLFGFLPLRISHSQSCGIPRSSYMRAARSRNESSLCHMARHVRTPVRRCDAKSLPKRSAQLPEIPFLGQKPGL